MASPLTSLNLSGSGTNYTNASSNGYHNNGNSSSTATSSSSTSSNIYRIGDYVYIEAASTSPYQVCKIEELIKNTNGNVEVKSICFYRRRDISGSLVQMAEKQAKQCALEDDPESEIEQLPDRTKHQVKLRELYLTRQMETYPISSIRGRCTVSQLCEAEMPTSFLEKEDAFFYTLVYDPSQRTLSPPERGDIRVGSRYQAEVPPKSLEDPTTEDTRNLADLETLVFNSATKLNDMEIDQFLTVAKSLGLYGRALDSTSSIKQPSLHLAAASASRDFTIQTGMDTLHRCDYDIAKAVFSLVPDNNPNICRDQIEEWTSAEASLFEEAFEKHEKKFSEIRQNFLPWKTPQNLIEYYYMWKTTDRYVQQKRVKAVENESRLKQVYIPNYNKQSLLNGSTVDQNGGKQCESCKKSSTSSWHSWGLPQYQYSLCHSCWNFWKKFGAFKSPNRMADMSSDKFIGAGSAALLSTSQSNTLARPPPIADLNSPYPCRECNKVFNRQERLASHMLSHRPHKCNVTQCGKEFKFRAHLQRHYSSSHAGSIPVRSGSPRPIMKTRAAFYYTAVPALRVARRICGDVLNLSHAARFPFLPLNVAAFKQEYLTRHSKGVTSLPKLRSRIKGKVSDVSHRLGTPLMPKPEWLIALPKDQLPQPTRLTFPPTPKDDLKIKEALEVKSTINDGSRKRSIDQNGNSLPSKRRQMAPPSILGKSVPDLYENISKSTVSTSLNGRAKIATITSVSGQKQMISWVDAPDDVYFVANDKIKQIRRKVPLPELRRAARRPWKRCAKGLSTPSAPGAPSLPVSGNPGAASAHLASNSVSVPSNAAAAAAALNLAGLGPLSSSSSQQQAFALLQQQMMAQNMPLLANNHFGSASSFMGMSSNNSNSSASKLTR